MYYQIIQNCHEFLDFLVDKKMKLVRNVGFKLVLINMKLFIAGLMTQRTIQSCGGEFLVKKNILKCAFYINSPTSISLYLPVESLNLRKNLHSSVHCHSCIWYEIIKKGKICKLLYTFLAQMLKLVTRMILLHHLLYLCVFYDKKINKQKMWSFVRECLEKINYALQ